MTKDRIIYNLVNIKQMNSSFILGFIGGYETIVALIVIVVLFGGKKIPELMRGLGKGIKDFKEATNIDEIKKEINDIKDSSGINDVADDIKDVKNQIGNKANEMLNDDKK